LLSGAHGARGFHRASVDVLGPALASELEEQSEPDLDTGNAVCRCVTLLAGTLKPEYAAALRRVEVDGLTVQQFAVQAGVTANNAGVRLFRAREALRKRAPRCGVAAGPLGFGSVVTRFLAGRSDARDTQER
jgi:DNA-directed RNA polymerase specialized sigma24 family protein